MYNCETQPCKRCIQRGFTCVKVWGPKQTALHKHIEDTASSVVSLKLWPVVLAPIRLAESSNEIAPHLHEFYRRLGQESDYRIIIQHLWNVYGPMFSNNCPCLQSAIVVLGFSLRLRFERTCVLVPCFEWLSRFHHQLEQALQDDCVNESHLFALFWILMAHHYTDLWFETDEETLQSYLIGFSRIMRHLSTSVALDRHSTSPLRYIWPLILSIVRLAPLLQSPSTAKRHWWDLHTLYRIIGPPDDGLILPRSGHFYHRCNDFLKSLKACLFVFLQPRWVRPELPDEQMIQLSVKSLRKEIDTFKKTEEVEKLIIAMVLSFDLECANDQHSLPLWNIAIHEIGAFASWVEYKCFRVSETLLMLCLVEKVIFGATSNGIARFVCQFFHRALVSLTDHRRYNLLMSTVFLAGDLLDSQNPEGTKIFISLMIGLERLWVKKWLHLNMVRRESKLLNGPCEILEKLWSSDMQTNDYAQYFLHPEVLYII